MQPEHYDFSSSVFLPVSHETCQALLDDASLLDSLSDAQLAAVLVVQNLAQAREQVLDPGAAEKVLAKLLAWAVGKGLQAEARRLFDARKLYFGLEVIKGSRLQLLSAEEVAAADYLLADGTWDTQFRVRRHHAHNPFSQQTQTGFDKERWLTREQDKLLRVLRANPDEDLHVQGYAGIGKSYLLGALMDSLPRGRVLPLARTPAKLETLRRRIGSDAGKAGRTFGAFARELLEGPHRQPNRAAPRLPGKGAVAETLGIVGFRQYGAEKTLDICLELLASYCESRDHSLSAWHLPHFEQPLSRVDGQVLVEYASRLWTWLQANPAWDRHTGFPALLLLKRACLAGCSVPARYSHVIVDESQDMPGPLLQIIERGRQVLITLGDEYQRAKGPGPRRQRQVRQRDIALSVRCGPKVERLINPLIGVHSQKSKIAFEGAGSVDVGIEHYPLDFVPPEGCVVLTATPWDSMKWALQLAGNACAFGFPDNPDMLRFMLTAVQLFRADFYGAGDSGPDAHPYFAHTVDWRQVREANRFDEAFLWVEARLQEGLKVADLNGLGARLGNAPGSLLLMVAEDAGGLEFDQVLLTAELMSLGKFKDAYAFDSRVCAVYIALSRARRQLYLPYAVDEWVAYHKGQQFRESHGY
ncbi:hypothetical protein P0Y43_26795 [Pseudomonas entomophila]|uniref:hypothetical protein n=1 Tax=Pseudomonas entomophila TaxID=312306 RepID=UPI0023D8BC85|nr:hypothetical protein [Pseudomonas entomophila]MDF0734300.1 hypothetical protein [Pseudomonas entomophila]